MVCCFRLTKASQVAGHLTTRLVVTAVTRQPSRRADIPLQVGLAPPFQLTQRSLVRQESTSCAGQTADMDYDAAPHPPDFSTAADGLRRAADELERCANIPAVDSGVHVMQMMRALMERLEGMEQQMRRGFEGLGERMTALDRKVTAS